MTRSNGEQAASTSASSHLHHELFRRSQEQSKGSSSQVKMGSHQRSAAANVARDTLPDYSLFPIDEDQDDALQRTAKSWGHGIDQPSSETATVASAEHDYATSDSQSEDTLSHPGLDRTDSSFSTSSHDSAKADHQKGHTDLSTAEASNAATIQQLEREMAHITAATVYRSLPSRIYWEVRDRCWYASLVVGYTFGLSGMEPWEQYVSLTFAAILSSFFFYAATLSPAYAASAWTRISYYVTGTKSQGL